MVEEDSLLFGNKPISNLIGDKNVVVHKPFQNPLECSFL